MTKPHALKPIILAVGITAGIVAAVPSFALNRGTNDLGRPFVSGGIDSDELATMKAERGQYSLQLLTAAQGTGAYLADVHVQITDQSGHTVLDTVMDGPYLMADLPAGRYQIDASLNGSVRKQTVVLGARDHRQAAIYFDTHDQVEPPSQAANEATDQANQASRITASGPGAGPSSGDQQQQ